MFAPHQAPSHGQLMRMELGESADHLWRATTHAAGGLGATVGPRWHSTADRIGPGVVRVRNATVRGWLGARTALTPLMLAARAGSAGAMETGTKARKKMVTSSKGLRMPRKRAGLLAGLLAAAATAAATAALVARRRNRARWEEYEAHGGKSSREDAGAMLDSARAGLDTAAHQVSRAAQTAGDRAAGWADQAKESSSALADRASRATEHAAAKGGEALEAGKAKEAGRAKEAGKAKTGEPSGSAATPPRAGRG